MPFRGLWEIPLEAVHLDHSTVTAPRGLNKQPLVVISHKPIKAIYSLTITSPVGVQYGKVLHQCVGIS